MNRFNSPTLKSGIIYFLLTVLGGLVSIALYDHVLGPSTHLLPYIPVFAYNSLATSLSLLFLVGLVLGIWHFIKECSKRIAVKELRAQSIEQIRSWPTSKWDVVWALAIAYFLFFMVLMITMIQVVPKERLVGVISPEEAASIAVYLLMLLLVLLLPLMVRALVQDFKDELQKWRSGTRRDKAILVASATFAIVTCGVVWTGEYAGWDHLLWFNVA